MPVHDVQFLPDANIYDRSMKQQCNRHVKRKKTAATVKFVLLHFPPPKKTVLFNSVKKVGGLSWDLNLLLQWRDHTRHSGSGGWITQRVATNSEAQKRKSGFLAKSTLSPWLRSSQGHNASER